MMLIAPSVNSDWPYNTQSRELQADWFILEMNEKAILQIDILNEIPTHIFNSYTTMYLLHANTQINVHS